MIVTVVSLGIAVLSIVLAVWFYSELRRWAKDCESAAVVIAYKRKVVMSPTLVELLLWSRKVPEDRTGQTFYKGPNVTVAIIKPVRRPITRHLKRKKSPGQAESQMGTWSMGDKEAS